MMDVPSRRAEGKQVEVPSSSSNWLLPWPGLQHSAKLGMQVSGAKMAHCAKNDAFAIQVWQGADR